MRELNQAVESAFSRGPTNWMTIDWHHVHRSVRGMQLRIAKATQEGDWRRVKALQRMLTRSLTAKMLAVRRVTENQGKRTAGVDRVLWTEPRQRWNAISQLRRCGYTPPAAAARLHPEIQREGASAGHSYDAGPGHAGATPAGIGTGCREHGRPE